MRYQFIAAQRSQHKVDQMCRVLRVSPSGYYAWQTRPESQRTQANRVLLVRIKAEYQRSQKTYGSPRIHAALRRTGVVCNRKRVARLMRLEGITGKKAHRRAPQTTRPDPTARPAPNLLNQDFSSLAPNQKWVVDLTYIDTAEGWLFLAIVLDLYSRQVVGWAMDQRKQTSLVEAALRMALRKREPAPSLLHHSDQGSEYTSKDYQLVLTDHHCQVSMSRTGNCFDNAAMESFFSTLKTECAHHQFASRSEARRVLFEYIEGWYNRQRLHSALGYRSPVEFELISRH